DTSKVTPEWFIPWYELVVDEWNCLGEGGFGSVYRAKWLDSDVVVKRRAETVAIFRREVEIWFSLSHPHVVRLFGACHVGRPFFVCEYATHGTLVSFLRKHPGEIWTKLHESALGVQYLHARGVVHGDLKGNNIVIGSDMKAKVTDFGLSSVASGEDKTSSTNTSDVVGSMRWQAPEVLEGMAPSFESDVYSLGMCILEAATWKQPWGDTDHWAVRHFKGEYHATHGELPSRPRICEDDQWGLIQRMCALEPDKRIKISTVVDELAV
ncbi:hypothetical protein PHYSODRAFT_408934, partial [Phytophthora sojae]